MSRFFDPRYNALAPYTPGEQPGEGKYTKLNTNESPYPPSPKVAGAVAGQVEKLNLYPDNTGAALRAAFAEQTGLDVGQILLGNGSDELLAFCFQGFCPAGAAFADITYGFYPVYSQFYGVDPLIIPLREDYSLDIHDYADLGRTIFIANPNAPTGIALSRDKIRDVLRWNPASLVVVDEAYVDFGAESALPLLSEFDNLLIIGTFSKSRQLAGGRLGYAFGCADLIADLNRMKYSFNPYNVNRLTLAAAETALRDDAYFQDCRAKVMKTREHTLKRLRERDFTCTDSMANFVFAAHSKAPAGLLHRRLREAGVLVRLFDRPRTENHLRVTIGTDEEMDIFFAALDDILKS